MQLVFHGLLGKYSNQSLLVISCPKSVSCSESPWSRTSFVVWERMAHTWMPGSLIFSCLVVQTSAVGFSLCISFHSVFSLLNKFLKLRLSHGKFTGFLDIPTTFIKKHVLYCFYHFCVHLCGLQEAQHFEG